DKVPEDAVGEILCLGSVKDKVYVDCFTIQPNTASESCKRIRPGRWLFGSCSGIWSKPYSCHQQADFRYHWTGGCCQAHCTISRNNRPLHFCNGRR
ncbi:hypothetical protein A1O3_00575, partial [Capronia epimyces CBS 606.96]